MKNEQMKQEIKKNENNSKKDKSLQMKKCCGRRVNREAFVE